MNTQTLFGLVTQYSSPTNDVRGGGILREEPKERLRRRLYYELMLKNVINFCFEKMIENSSTFSRASVCSHEILNFLFCHDDHDHIRKMLMLRFTITS